MPTTMLYLNGQEQVVFNFDTEANKNQWMAGVQNIKSQIEWINTAVQVNQRAPYYHEWLDVVETFRVRWGNDKTPPDIKTAVHGVQNGLGIPRTAFE